MALNLMMPMKNTLEELKSIALLRDLPEAQLNWLAEKATVREFNAGDIAFKKGDPIEYLYVVFEGRVVFKIEQSGQFREFGQISKGDISGALPYSRAKEAVVFGITAGATRLLCLRKEHFQEMIRSHHELTEVLVHTMISRVREFTKTQQQNEKLMSLGKLSAGLAHELNNPAAAVVRSAAALRKHLGAVPEKYKRVLLIRLSAEQVDAVNDLLFSKMASGKNAKLSLRKKTEREDELTDWLDDRGIEDGQALAETFVEYGLTIADLEKILHEVSDKFLAPALEWLDNVLNTEKLVKEIEEASQRIATLVASIKTYTHMDQAPDQQLVDVKIGINSTLTMLSHELEKKNIQVTLDLPEDLPKIMAFAGELNQVWTNLIDNAIAAMEQNGALQIEARPDREFVVVRIIDNGAGIPQEIQSQIFDPFFTTKKMGEGTGLGLDIVQKIIRQHNADIKFTSEPGRTEFKDFLAGNLIPYQWHDIETSAKAAELLALHNISKTDLPALIFEDGSHRLLPIPPRLRKRSDSKPRLRKKCTTW